VCGARCQVRKITACGPPPSYHSQISPCSLPFLHVGGLGGGGGGWVEMPHGGILSLAVRWHSRAHLLFSIENPGTTCMGGRMLDDDPGDLPHLLLGAVASITSRTVCVRCLCA
jgi:hypothetical protein